MWKVFFCSSISTFLLNILVCINDGETVSITNAGLVKFGEYDENPYNLADLPFFLILGALGGLLGAFFIFVNYSINKFRYKYTKTKIRKIIDTLALVFITCTTIYLAPLILRTNCFDANESELEATYI